MQKNSRSRNSYYEEFPVYGFSRMVLFLLLFLPFFCLSQIYASKDAVIFDPDNAIKTDNNNSKKGDADIYIVKGTVTSGLENQSVVVAYIDNPETEVLLRSVHNDAKSYAEKKHGSKNTKKEISGRTETPKQKTLVYKPLNPENQPYFSSGKVNYAVSASPSFSAKNVITGDVKVEIPKVLSHKNQKTFSPENENSIKLPTSHTVRPPPIFCIC